MVKQSGKNIYNRMKSKIFTEITAATEGIVYTRDQLIALCKPALLPGARLEVPKELRRRHRGCRAGVKRRVKKRRRHRPAVPAIVMGNVRSLGNKTDPPPLFSSSLTTLGA